MSHSPPNRRHYGIDRAQRALDTEIELAVRERDGRLRSIRAMARAADVSLVTMWKAVQVRRERGDLRVRSRGAITTAPHFRTDPTPPATAQARPRAWESVVVSITADLARRAYPEGGVLPPVKLLASRYGVAVNHATGA